MKLLADEDIPSPVIDFLEKELEIEAVDKIMKGATDKEVLEYADDNELILLAFDEDFTKYNHENHSGIIYLTKRTAYHKVAEAIRKTVEAAEPEDLENEVFMVSP